MREEYEYSFVRQIKKHQTLNNGMKLLGSLPSNQRCQRQRVTDLTLLRGSNSATSERCGHGCTVGPLLLKTGTHHPDKFTCRTQEHRQTQEHALLDTFDTVRTSTKFMQLLIFALFEVL